jgi:TetR/AcrR family tetracycline transcriptional repressor
VAKLNREHVVAEALDLLDEVGLDGVTTRRLALRLGVEQPSLYWHFRKKDDLLSSMAEAAMLPLAAEPLPEPTDDWQAWFADNFRSFRRTLLMRRDGARLHAGLVPGADLDRIYAKLAFLTGSGVPEHDAQMALLAGSRFTIGSVLEQQADGHGLDVQSDDGRIPVMNHDAAFEGGLGLIIAGLAKDLTRPVSAPR